MNFNLTGKNLLTFVLMIILAISIVQGATLSTSSQLSASTIDAQQTQSVSDKNVGETPNDEDKEEEKIVDIKPEIIEEDEKPTVTIEEDRTGDGDNDDNDRKENDDQDETGLIQTDDQLTLIEENQAETNDDEREIKESLNLRENVSIKKVIVRKLIQKKVEDRQNFNDIIELTNEVSEITQEKITVVEEITEMDKDFIRKIKLKARIVKEKQKIKKQIREYIQHIKTKQRVKIIIQREKIKKLYNKELDMDQLIEEIWNSREK